MKNNIAKTNIPNSPGVYHFLDEKGAVLYVGKAKNLRNRIRQYFLKELGRGPAIEQMVRMAKDIKWIETESEIEAVILEADIIGKLKPKYNVRLKDDKSFLMIKITKEEFPCVRLVRFKDVDLTDKKNDYFGPYPAGEMLRKSLRYLRKIFPYRDCSNTKFAASNKRKRSCLYGDIHVCTSPCTGLLERGEYLKNIKFLKKFLKGKKTEIIKALEKEMANLSKTRCFEEAANVRNQLSALRHLKDVAVGIRDDFFKRTSGVFKRIECYDISNIQDEYAVGSMIVFTNGEINKEEYRKFRIKNEAFSKKEAPQSDLVRLQQVLTRRFKNDWPLPDLILIDGGPAQLKVAKDVVESYNLTIPVISISKGPERKKNDFHFGGLEVANQIKNDKTLKDILISARDEAHRFAISYYRKLHRKGVFEK